MECLRLWWAALALLLWAPHVRCRAAVTHEDIRDAMVSLIRMFMNAEDKMTRHEQRERALGEYVKKMLKEIDKSQKSFEPIKGILSRFDERLANIETITLQKEQREKETQNETNKALEAIRKSVEALTNTINQNIKPPAPEPTHKLEMRLAVTDAKIDALSSEINNLKNNLSKQNLRDICSESSDASLDKFTLESERLLNKFELTMNEFVNSSKVPIDYVPLSEVSLADEAWHSKMTEVMERQEKDINKIQRLLSDAESMWKGLPRTIDLNAATNQTLKAIEVAKHNVTENAEQLMERQEKEINKIQRLLSDAESMWKGLPRTSDLNATTNQTLKAIEVANHNVTENAEQLMERQEKKIINIQRLLSDAKSMWERLPRKIDLNATTDQTLKAIEVAKHDVTENAEQLTNKLTKKLQELSNRLTSTNEDVQKSLTEGNTMTEQAFNNMSRQYNTLRNDMELINKQHQALVEATSKNIVEIKSWLDHRLYGVKSELRENMHLQNKHLNSSLSERLENIETAIITTHDDISDSLSKKLELEISQVKRQIGVMFQKVSFNKMILDQIQEQTRNYVNVSGSSMEDMKNKVGLITMHMADVQDNLNYLLGKLSLSSQEFNQIKDKLSKALDDIRDSFTKVKKHVDDTPGLSWIPSSEQVSST